MDYEEFKRRLGKSGLNIREFAELMHINGNTVSNYATKGAVPIHFAVAVTLMAEMADGGLDFRGPLKCIHIESRRQRDPLRSSGFGRSKQHKIQWQDNELAK